MYRSHTCGQLRASHINTEVVLSGWAHKVRDKGFVVWVDIRDRYGITQLVLDEERTTKELLEQARNLGRETVIKASGKVIERASKNDTIPTGEIEVLITSLEILNASELPPFTIEDDTDGGEEIRMQYRYLDIRRNPVKNNLIFRHKVTIEVRKYLSDSGFIEVETPYLIKSTPEGARDFVVPSRMNEGQFYALPQSPQTFKQLLMVGGMDKYFQIVKCFRDEDLRADRQPEFTQIDCEMAFVEQEDILNTFEGLTKHLLKEIKGVEVDSFPRMTFDAFTRKEIDKLIDWVKRPQVGAKGMVYCRCNDDGTYKSSVDKFYDQDDLANWAKTTGAQAGDLILVLSGDTNKTRVQLSALRMELAERLQLRKADEFAPLWVIDFPLLELDEETGHYHAMHHPFTSPKPGQLELLDSDPGAVRANAYDLVLNGNEIGGGSIRIHDKETQAIMFKHLGFTPDEAKAQFGFLMDAFQYGAPPHGGIAFGLDRLVAILGGQETIRDFIAFPKNNSGRDVMIDAPAPIDQEQLKELNLKLDL